MIFRLFCILMISFFLVSCTQNNSSSKRTNDDTVNVEQSSYQKEELLNNQQIASHLAGIAREVPDVNYAAAIVAGPYAVIGINIDEEVEKQRVGSIKYSVSEAIKLDPYGKTAVVIADADMTKRIQEMTLKVQNGQPIQGVVDELAEIVSRYMPTFPVDDQRPVDPSENNEKLEHEEQKKMDHIEKEQSNS